MDLLRAWILAAVVYLPLSAASAAGSGIFSPFCPSR